MPSKETTKTEVKVLIQPTQEATTDASAPQDSTITWSSLHFLYLHISIHNSMFWCLIFWDWMYYWWCIIYRHHFLFQLGIFLFPLLTNSFVFFLNMWFLLYDSDSMSLGKYHFLPIFQSLLSYWGQCSAWLGGELRKEVLLLILSYFGNLVVFCLILEFLKVFFLYSPWLLRKNSQKWKGRNWIFVFFLDLKFVLCLLKLMNFWNFYWIQP